MVKLIVPLVSYFQSSFDRLASAHVEVPQPPFDDLLGPDDSPVIREAVERALEHTEHVDPLSYDQVVRFLTKLVTDKCRDDLSQSTIIQDLDLFFLKYVRKRKGSKADQFVLSFVVTLKAM
ncbi:MAG: hypothetical protein V2I33_20880 [Kangiellaceae bacterium]|nr:hypothetical protein [Kangiellaceae bacterium]